jgi:Glycosyltransferase family 87
MDSALGGCPKASEASAHETTSRAAGSDQTIWPADSSDRVTIITQWVTIQPDVPAPRSERGLSGSSDAAGLGAAAPVADRSSSFRHAFVIVTSVVVFGLLPLWPLYDAFANVVIHHGIVTDFKNTFYPAGDAVRHGVSPYARSGDDAVALGRAYVFPPLVALTTVPLTLFPVTVAEVLVLALLTAAVVLTLWILGVRDWRCYGLVFLWPPFLAAVKTGNVTALLALGAALTWRYRDRAAAAGASVGLSLAAKIFLWPLLLWMGATRRWKALLVSVGVAVIVLVASWAAIGFAGLHEYPDLLRRLQDLEAPESYTLYALALDLGAPTSVARLIWAAVAVALLVSCALVARRGDDRRAFILALAAALACSPIVWLNYFVLLAVVLAVAEPRLGPAWFVPLVMYASASTYNGSTFQNALTIVAAAVTVALALRRPGPRRELAGAMRPAAERP